jgi:hypothetical protein
MVDHVKVLRFIVEKATEDEVDLILHVARAQKRQFELRATLKEVEEHNTAVYKAMAAWTESSKEATTEAEMIDAFNQLDKRHRAVIAKSTNDVNPTFLGLVHSVLNKKLKVAPP